MSFLHDALYYAGPIPDALCSHAISRSFSGQRTSVRFVNGYPDLYDILFFYAASDPLVWPPGNIQMLGFIDAHMFYAQALLDIVRSGTGSRGLQSLLGGCQCFDAAGGNP